MRNALNHITLVVLAVCSGSIVVAQSHDTEKPGAEPDNIYKHYTGTIGNKKVIVDLRYGFNGSSNYGGSTYHFAGEDKFTQFMIRQPQSFAHNVLLTATESIDDTDIEKSPIGRNEAAPKWRFTIAGNKLTGSRFSAGNEVHQDIKLVEDYGNSTAFNVVAARHSSIEMLPGADNPRIETYLTFVTPSSGTSETDARLIEDGVMKVAGFTRKEVPDFGDLPKAFSQQFTDTCHRRAKASFTSIDSFSRFMKMATIMPVYNDNGIVVLENNEVQSELTGIVAGFSYHCIDLHNHREYPFSEMMNTDKTKLGAILEMTIRENFRLEKSEKLSTWLRSDKMPVSNFFYPVEKGMIFVYKVDDLIEQEKITPMMFRTQISLYVPYGKLDGLLLPGFKKRLGI